MVISDAFPILNYVTQFSHIWSDMIFTGAEQWLVLVTGDRWPVTLVTGVNPHFFALLNMSTATKSLYGRLVTSRRMREGMRISRFFIDTS